MHVLLYTCNFGQCTILYNPKSVNPTLSGAASLQWVWVSGGQQAVVSLPHSSTTQKGLYQDAGERWQDTSLCCHNGALIVQYVQCMSPRAPVPSIKGTVADYHSYTHVESHQYCTLVPWLRIVVTAPKWACELMPIIQHPDLQSVNQSNFNVPCIHVVVITECSM